MFDDEVKKDKTTQKKNRQQEHKGRKHTVGTSGIKKPRSLVQIRM